MSDDREKSGTEQVSSAAEIAEKVRRLIHLRGLKQSVVARESEVSATTLSQFLAGKYAGDSEAIAAKLSAWLDNLRRRDQLPSSLVADPEFIETPTAARIIADLEYAQLTGWVVLILGMPGVGKTKALSYYAQTRPSAWLVTMTPDTEQPVPMLEEIGFALGLRELGGGAAKMRREIVRRVRNTGGILLIDEAQHLGPKAVETLRAIRDAAGIAIALSGHPALSERIDGFAQLSSRVAKRAHLPTSKPGDVLALAKAFEISSADEITALQKIAALGGALRSVAMTLRLACLYADGEGSGRPPTLRHIKAAWENLSGGGAP